MITMYVNPTYPQKLKQYYEIIETVDGIKENNSKGEEKHNVYITFENNGIPKRYDIDFDNYKKELEEIVVNRENNVTGIGFERIKE